MQDGNSKAPAPTRQHQPITVIVASGGGNDAAMRGQSQSSDSRVRRQRCGRACANSFCDRMADICGPIFLGRQYKRTFGDEEGGSGSGGGDTGDNGSKGRRRGAVPVVLVAFLYSVTALAFTVYIITTFVLEHRCKSAQRAARENPQLVAPGSAAATAAAAAAAKARTAALLADSCSRGSEAAKWGLMAAFMLSNLAFCIAVIYMHRRRTQRQKERQLQRQREGLEVADAAAAATAPATAATTTTNAEATTTTNAEATPATPPTDHDMAKAAA